MAVKDGDVAWLINASYEAGQLHLNFINAEDKEQVRWDDQNFHPYYLTEKNQKGQVVKKLDLFTEKERTLHKINYEGDSARRKMEGWELDVDPALSYVYDKGLRFGILHRFEDNAWIPQAPLNDEQQSHFNELFTEIKGKDPLKYDLVKDAYAYTHQPIPRIGNVQLGLSNVDGSQEDYYNAFLLSRIANLPIPRTYKNYTVSEWIRSMLYTYYRTHNILIPNSEELRLGDTRKYVTGALTIAPESGTYFNMHVLDFESLYPGCIDVFNLSYETVRCPHRECQQNLVPGMNINVCTKRRGIYSALTGALRDLRIRVFKPLTRTTAPDDVEGEKMRAASRILKLFLVSCYGVTIRIHGLASPMLGEAITAYGRHILQSTWDMAKGDSLKPRYGDTDSVFLDNPSEADVTKFTNSVMNRFKLELASDRIYSVCVLSSAKKAYFGILPSGEPEIKGLSIAKSNSPTFFQQTFQHCLTKLSEGRQSINEFEEAKQQLPKVVEKAIQQLKQGKVPITDLEYRVELRDDPKEKLKSRVLPQPYQAASLLLSKGKKIREGDTVNFVKVKPFRIQGKQYTVKPSSQATLHEVNVNDYIRNLISSLAQTFEPMNINLKMAESNLSNFI